MKNEKVSIKTIALLSGVSVATVSRVINQNGRFSAETEARVRQVMKNLNYHPNIVAKSLRESHSRVIGAILPDITSPHFARLILEMETYLFAHSYSVVICNTNESKLLEQKHVDTLISQRVSGILFLSGNTHEIPEDISAVYVDRCPEGFISGKHDLVESDNHNGGYIAAKKLIEKGCRNIAVLYIHNSDSNNIKRCEGYREAMQESLLPVRMISVDVSAASVATSAVARSIEEDGLFDGLVCTNDVIAVGALQALLDKGIRVPDQVKLTGYDDTTLAITYRPSITSIHQDTSSLARESADLLLRRIEGKTVKQNHIMIPVRLVERETTG